ncbi:hypothetical protein ABW20_dc0102405 [Dactylellina cionopaga]|nr:hypothetical protein ABW20_dc0102405 [Dactylellina cionopaga]
MAYPALIALPTEIQYQILSYIPDIVDQACINQTCVLWSDLIRDKSLQRSRYHTDRGPYAPTVHKLFDISAGSVRCDAENGLIVGYRLKTHKHGLVDVTALVEDPLFSPFSGFGGSFAPPDDESIPGLQVSNGSGSDDDRNSKDSSDSSCAEDMDPTDRIWFKIRIVRDIRNKPWIGWERIELGKKSSIKSWIDSIFEKIKSHLQEQMGNPYRSFEIYFCEGKGYLGRGWVLDIFVFAL